MTKANLATEQLAGRICKALVKELQSMKKIWGETPQAEQEAYIDHCENIAIDLVTGALDVIMGDGTEEFPIAVHNTTTHKETIEAKISVSRSEENALDLHKIAHAPARLLATSKRGQYLDLGKRPESNHDQPMMFEREKNETDTGVERPQRSDVAVGSKKDAPPSRKGRSKKAATTTAKPRSNSRRRKADDGDNVTKLQLA